MADTQIKIYPYKQKKGTLWLCILFFGACTLILGNTAANNDSGVVINGIIRLSPEHGTWFYWTLTVCAAGFVALGLFALLKSGNDLKITLDELYLRAPKSAFNSRIISIPYKDIKNMKLSAVSQQTFLTIEGAQKKVVIVSNMLPDKEAFDDMVTEIRNRHTQQKKAA